MRPVAAAADDDCVWIGVLVLMRRREFSSNMLFSSCWFISVENVVCSTPVLLPLADVDDPAADASVADDVLPAIVAADALLLVLDEVMTVVAVTFWLVSNVVVAATTAWRVVRALVRTLTVSSATVAL